MNQSFENRYKGSNPFNPPSLRDNQILLGKISEGLKHDQERYSSFAHSAFTIKVDGLERYQCDAGTESFSFPISPIAASVKLCGRDQEGDVLLAFFPLPDLYEMTGEEKIIFDDKTGPTYTLSLAPVRDGDGALTGGIATVGYSKNNQEITELP